MQYNRLKAMNGSAANVYTINATDTDELTAKQTHDIICQRGYEYCHAN